MITTVAMHGTTLRKGVSFDSTRDPWVNDRGDVAFAANTNGDVLTEAIYVKRAATGRIEAIPQPSGFFGAYAPIINNRGDVVYDLQGHKIADGIGAIYLNTGGNSPERVAGTGDSVPGLVGNISIIAQVIVTANLALNNAGQVAFDVAADTGDEALL